jgi:acyl-CoA synthetase (AMP-forming)/AMP-acid ligase II
MINAAGFKVWPAEVEALLYQHPAVQEACVIAAQDARRGETVKAVVVLKPVLPARSPSSRSPTGRTSTWPPTRCRASCSSLDNCPRAAPAR